MELKDYTTEELRAELKRRRTKAMKEAKKEPPKYKEFTATIEKLDYKYGSISEYAYSITDVNPHNNDINSELFNNIRKEAKYEKRNIEEAAKKNEQLNRPAFKNKKYYIFRNNYKKIGYKKTSKKMLSFKEKIVLFVKNNHILYNLLKKIKQ